jgi:hypothetical protein
MVFVIIKTRFVTFKLKKISCLMVAALKKGEHESKINQALCHSYLAVFPLSHGPIIMEVFTGTKHSPNEKAISVFAMLFSVPFL